MRQIPSNNLIQPPFNILILQTINKALYKNKELFYYTKAKTKIENLTYEEALKYLANLDTVYFDLNEKEKKLYKKLEKIIKEYNIQK